MKMTMKKKTIVVEVGVWADRLTYFAQNHHILETADFKTFPSFYRMTKAQEKEYCEFCKKLDDEYVEQYICRPEYIYHIWFKEGYDCTYSCGEMVWKREVAQ